MQRMQGALPQATPPALCPTEALQRYLILIYPGLVGAVTMVSCSIPVVKVIKGIAATTTAQLRRIESLSSALQETV